MSSLYESLKTKVNVWRTGGYPHAEYSSMSEILDWAGNPEGSGFRLRLPQQRALETSAFIAAHNYPSVGLIPRKEDSKNRGEDTYSLSYL
jgi:hypothetical protein